MLSFQDFIVHSGGWFDLSIFELEDVFIDVQGPGLFHVVTNIMRSQSA